MAFSVFPRGQQRGVSLTDMGVSRRSSTTHGRVTSKQALQNSAMWACVRLHADLESTVPIDTQRRSVTGQLIDMKTPHVLVTPDEWAEGQPMLINEWLYARRVSLSIYGNAIGIITERDGSSLPRQIHLVDAEDVTVRGKGGRIVEYRIGNTEYKPKDIWHDRQYLMPGSPLGLSPLSHAALSLQAHRSAAQLTIDWFDRSASPALIVRNNKDDLNDDAAVQKIKRRLSASIHNGEPLVMGQKWEVQLATAKARDAAFLELMDHSVVDIARFFSTPARAIDGVVSGQAVTYANLTQDLLHLLVVHAGPNFTRTEKSLSRLVPGDGFMKLNSDALMRMDPEARRRLSIDEYNAGLITQEEARALENRPPLPEGTQP
jgi:HK97 family phage portal protein